MKIRIGLIGVGAIAVESHLPALRHLGHVEIAALCDQRIETARKVASDFGVKSVYGDAKEMLSKERLDAVDICTSPASHAPLSIQAMEAGCHVLIEKPMASNLEEADAMVDCSHKQKVKLCVVHQNICNPVVIRAKQMVESGAVGQLLSINVGTFERRDGGMILVKDHWCHKLPGGIFYEILPHPIYVLQTFAKELNPVCVMGAKRADIPWMPVDELRVLLKGTSLGLITASCNPPVHGDTLDILGTKMVLRGDLWGRTLLTQKTRTKSPVEVGVGNLQLSSQLFGVIGGTISSAIRMAWGVVSAHYVFISEFINSVLDETPPPTTPEEARETLRLLESICSQIENQH